MSLSASSKRAVLGLILIDWLDFGLYLYMAKTIFAPTFFAKEDEGLLLSFGLFFIAYLARPLGGWYFGTRADHQGRRHPLIFAAALMGLSTLGIALLPDYTHIGYWACLGLMVLRMGQSFALGGEIKISAMYLLEHCPAQRMKIGSEVAIYSALGLFLGGILASLVQISSAYFSWRLLFAILGILSLMLCQMRKALRESPEYLHAPQETRPQITLLKKHWKGLATILILSLHTSMMVYICNVFWVSLAIEQQLTTPFVCTLIGSLAQLFSALFAYPIVRYFSAQSVDTLLKTSMVILGLAAPWQFYFTASQALIQTIACLGLYVLANGLLCSALYLVLYKQLPSTIRCTYVASFWAIGASTGAGCLPLMQYLTHHDYLLAPGLGMSGVAWLALIGYQTLNQSKDWYREEDSNLHGVTPTST